MAVSILTHGDAKDYKRDEGKYFVQKKKGKGQVSDNREAVRDHLWAYDEELYLEDLTKPFKTQNCHESLRGKPKLFFIQVNDCPLVTSRLFITLE